jgi:hypothetical protein
MIDNDARQPQEPEGAPTQQTGTPPELTPLVDDLIALDFARRLGVLMDVPLVVCEPSSGKPEFHYPKGERDKISSVKNSFRLAGWKPGKAIMGVMGGKVAAIDVDPRNGGDVDRVREMLATLSIRVFAEVETPSGGRHFYVAGDPELASAHDLTDWPGIDIQSYGSLLFLPGTQRPKYNGAGYKIIFEDFEALADGGDPDGGAALAGWVAEHRVSREKFEPSPPWDGKPPDRRQAAYLQAMLDQMHRDLAAMVKDSGRNNAIYRAGLKIGNFVTGAGLDERRAEKVLLDSCNHNGLIDEDGEKAVLASIRSGIRNGKTRPRAVPERNGQDHEPSDDGMPADNPYQDESKRLIIITSASKIKPARVRWLWLDRLAVGTLALLAGREGVGKSILAYWLVAAITRGVLPGEHHGQPKAVLVAASEDSWEHTIVPRLMAAGADLDLVYRVEVITSANVHSEITMPQDLHDLEQRVVEVGAVLLLLDPLMSRISDQLDTHRDAEVRLALEPLAALANRAHMAVLGIIHHNKSGSTDPLQVIMGSRAFTAVARSVHTVISDPEDETNRRRLFGTPKNNLGRSDLPTFSFVIDSFPIETPDDDVAWTGRLIWGAEVAGSISNAMERASESSDQKSAAEEAQGWLEDFLTLKGGIGESAKIKKAAYGAGHSEKALRSARQRLKIEIEQHGYPRQTWWSLPNRQIAREGSHS